MSTKKRPSKLDQYAVPLAEMEAAGKTLAEMQSWLKAEGCTVALSGISSFLSQQRSQRQQQSLLQTIASGARQCAAVEKQFSRNPAPELETLIKLQRVILLNLSTQANTTPETLDLIGNSFKAVFNLEKLKLQRDELELAKDKFEFDAAQACLARLPELKAVSDAPKLSADEKAKAIQSILFPK